MNGLDKIRNKIITDAENEAAAIIAEAAQQAQAIKDEAVRLAEQERARLQERGRMQAEESRSRCRSAAELSQRNAVLRRKQQLIDEAFVLATERIAQLPALDYAGWLTALVIKYSSSGTEEIVLPAADRDELGPHIVALANEYLTAQNKTAQLTLAEDTAAFDKGLLLRQGDIEINCSLRSIIAFRREQLAAEVAAQLFG